MTSPQRDSRQVSPAALPAENGSAQPAATAADLLTEEETERAIERVMELMAIPGPSGQEGAIVEAIRQRLLEAGVPASAIKTDTAHRRTRLAGQTGNLILKLPGTRRGARRMLSSHVDTVPICVGCRPVREGHRVRSAAAGTGLGADDRAGATVVLHTVLEILARDLPHPPLTCCWFVQEEVGLQGSRHLTTGALGKPSMAFNWDGGSPFKLTMGATSGYRMQITVDGVASHAGVAPEQGVSAIAIAGLAIADLQRRGWHGRIEQGKQRGTSNIGVVEGGSATNVVTDRVLVRAEARSHQARFRDRIVRQFQRAFEQAAREVTNHLGQTGRVQVEGHVDYEAFRLSPREPAVKRAESAVRHIGGEPVRAIADGGIDANWLHRHGIPTVTLGCGQMNPHMTSEQLDLEQFAAACRIALRLATAE